MTLRRKIPRRGKERDLRSNFGQIWIIEFRKLSSSGLILASICSVFLSLYTGAIAKSSIEIVCNDMRIANRSAIWHGRVACARKTRHPPGLEPTLCRIRGLGGVPLSDSTTAGIGSPATGDTGIAAGSPLQREPNVTFEFRILWSWELPICRNIQAPSLYILHTSRHLASFKSPTPGGCGTCP